MKNRITALFLAVVSILSMLTAPASAAAGCRSWTRLCGQKRPLDLRNQ